MDNNEYYFASTTPIGEKKKVNEIKIKDKRKEFYTIWQQVKK